MLWQGLGFGFNTNMKKTRRNFMKTALALGVLPLGLVAEEKIESKKEEEDKRLRFIHVTDSHI
jgi:hypothetical protein